VIVVNPVRKILIQELPIVRPNLIIRKFERSDMDLLQEWPSYPHPYGSFNFGFAGVGATEMDSLFRERYDDENRISLIVDHLSARAIGYISLIEVDWQLRGCGNMGIRVHPAWCGKGIGTAVIAAISEWWFDSGMNHLRLDVASSNKRAIRCYEKVGFTKYGEFWKAVDNLRGVNLTDPNWHFLNGHIRNISQIPELKFLLLELRRNQNRYDNNSSD
jgi:RimJ/RimL family protein N-acetyltransferase